ncbi:MAG: sensor domain-containing diguanylate cyclase [Candidatus Omnitrophota bacterium]|nr:sensor domain-containing diguanylate cyclase [Candidatus Omnitrophota bacterium]
MIKILKKQLFRDSFLLSLSFVFCLPIFFIYFLKFNPRLLFLFYLSLLVFIVVLYFMFIDSKRRERLIFLQKQDNEEKINLINAKIKEERISTSASEKKIVSYSSLKGVTEELSKCLTLQESAQTLCSLVCDILGKEDRVCILYLLETNSGDLSMIFTNKGKAHEIIKHKKGDIFDHWVIKKLQALIVEDIKKDFRFDLERIKKEELRPIRSLISVPLIVGKKVLGVLRMDSIEESSFSDDDLRLLSTISDLGAVAIENSQLYQKAEELAIKDGLTNLYLRRYLDERLNEEIGRSLRKGSVFSILMIDIDKFKDYNDKFGHMAGDIVLKTIAKILQMNFEQTGNIISRYGGEEFLIMLSECHKEKAQKVAEELRKLIKEKEITLRKKHTHVTVSIGVAAFPQDARAMDDLIRCADAALYAAKKAGRDKVCFWE